MTNKRKPDIPMVTYGYEGHVKLSNQASELIIESLYDLKDNRQDEIEKNKRLGRGLFCLEEDVDKIGCLIREMEDCRK